MRFKCHNKKKKWNLPPFKKEYEQYRINKEALESKVLAARAIFPSLDDNSRNVLTEPLSSLFAIHKSLTVDVNKISPLNLHEC